MRSLPVLLFSSILFSLPATAEQLVYCCRDKSGQQVCADILPPQCYDRPYRELNSRGITLRTVEPPLSAAQRAEKDAELLRQKDSEKQALTQRRRERALLASYASERDIAAARERALATHREVIREAQARLATANRKQATLEQEKAALQGKPLPPPLESALRENEDELKTSRSLIESHEREMAGINRRFDEESQRFQSLTSKPPTPMPAP